MIGAGAVLIAIAIAGIVLAVGSGSGRPASAQQVLRTPFVVDNVRFAVFASPSQPWTAFASLVSAGPGQRWLLVEVLVRNLARPGLEPGALDYRLTDGAGHTYLPDPNHGVTGTAPLAVAQITRVELAFHVPTAITAPRLTFAAGAARTARAEIPLGHG